MNDQPAVAEWTGLSPDAQRVFNQVAEQWEDDQLSEGLVNQALAAWGDDVDVLVGAYRYFFYKHRPQRALEVSERLLRVARTLGQLPAEWEPLEQRLRAGKEHDPAVRLYLSTYAAQGMLLAQLGRVTEALLITARVKALDDRREFCATTVWEVLNAPVED